MVLWTGIDHHFSGGFTVNKNDENRFRMAAQELGLSYDERGQAVYGIYRGFYMVLTQGAQRGAFVITTSASASGQLIDRKACLPYIKTSPNLSGVYVNRFTLTFTVKSAPFSLKKTFSRIPGAFADAANLLERLGAVCCCQDTGSYANLGIYMCGGAPAVLSMEAYAARSSRALQSQQAEFLKKENTAAGIVGAVLGSLIGVAAIVLIGQLGYIAAISGFIMAICTLKGYEKLGGKLSKKGVVICVIIMILMVYVGNRFDWALAVASAFETDVFTAFRAIDSLIGAGAIEAGSFYGNLGLIYLFVCLGAFPTVKNSLIGGPERDLGVYPLGVQPAYTAAPSADGGEAQQGK